MRPKETPTGYRWAPGGLRTWFQRVSRESGPYPDYAALHRILSCAPGADVGYAASYLRFLVACGTRIAISRDSLLVTLLWKTPTAVV